MLVVVVSLLAFAHPAFSAGGDDATAVSRLAKATATSTAALKDEAAAARDRFLEGEFAGAVAACDRLDAAFERSAAFRADDAAWAAWADSRVTRALALRRLAKDDESDEQLRALAVVRPTWAIDKGFAPPKFVARFEELREELLSGPSVAVTVDVADGSFVLDGKAASAGVVDVLPGAHFFGKDGKGQRLDVKTKTRVSLGDGKVATADPPTDPTPPPHVDDDLPPRPPDGASEEEGGVPWLGVGIGAAAVVVVGGIVTGVVLLSQPQVANPGGTTIKVDSSLLKGRQ